MLRSLTGIAVAFIVIVLVGWFVHGVILADQYAQLDHLYRAQADALFACMLGGQLLIAIALVCLLNMYGPMLSLGLGACFGFFIGLMSAGSQIITYSVMPLPGELISWWVGTSLIQMTILGALLADILKKE
ncbi:MAG: hypothetical protein R3352_00820 [Salinisphaeraceae bacterium]|nr:hypothetical protein [Salinisphaeraceae bacterium]